MKNKILVIAGPTAVGKTSLSIELAKALDGEIVSADSMQIYKGLNIGTAKPTDSEKNGVPHHMLDICGPEQRFSVAQYVKLANSAIEEIINRNKTPIVVGGTGLYIDNLIYDNDFGELNVDIELREELTAIAREKGGEYLLNQLLEFDPEYAAKLHPNDIKRIVHAIETYRTTGKTQSEMIALSREKPPRYSFLYAVLDCSSRSILYERINKRVDIMMEEGLLDEARAVVHSDWYSSSTASQAIGYKEFEPYFNGTSSLDVCIELLKQHSRNYAKRQLTWFRNKKEAKFYFVDTEENLKSRIMSDFFKENQ